MNTPDFFIKVFSHLTSYNFEKVIKLDHNPDHFISMILSFILCAVSVSIKSKIPESFFDHPTNFHSCASWAARKLLDLNDSLINKDIKGSWLASIAQLPSLYAGNIIEAMQPILSLGG